MRLLDLLKQRDSLITQYCERKINIVDFSKSILSLNEEASDKGISPKFIFSPDELISGIPDVTTIMETAVKSENDSVTTETIMPTEDDSVEIVTFAFDEDESVEIVTFDEDESTETDYEESSSS